MLKIERAKLLLHQKNSLIHTNYKIEKVYQMTVNSIDDQSRFCSNTLKKYFRFLAREVINIFVSQ